MKRLLPFLLLLIAFCANAQIEKAIPTRPVPPRLVNDFTNTITPFQRQALEDKLVAYDDSTSSQVAVVIINSLDGYDIAEYGLALGRKWGVGGKEFSNGIIIIVAKDDRKVRIEVGYGLEGAIPDITAKSIIDNSITPNFKEGNYYRGLDRAVDDIIKAAAGEYKAPANYARKKEKGIPGGSILGLIIFLIILSFLGGRRGGGGGGIGTGMILGSLLGGSGRGWSGGSGGGGGGGGFGGFGGGSFGGGGASGSW